MLYQITNAKKFDGDTRVNWYSDQEFDLITWLEDDGSIFSFQLIYNKRNNSRALTWKKEKGYLHELVDDGEIVGGHKRTPILLPDGLFEKDVIAERFKEHSAEIDQSVSAFVYDKLVRYLAV